jgi:hypothetical protein
VFIPEIAFYLVRADGSAQQEDAMKQNLSRMNQKTVARSRRAASMSGTLHRPQRLQCAVGNQILQRLLRTRLLQAKLTVSDPHDVYEQEAERVANEVVRMPGPTAAVGAGTPAQVQRLCPGCEEGLKRQPIEEEEPLQAKRLSAGTFIQRQLPEEEEEPVQAKADRDASQEVSTTVETGIHALTGSGRPLPESVRAYMEPRFHTDFSAVRLHTDANAHDLARSVNAQAFTVGTNVVFGAGRYAPETDSGKHLLAHELTHVVQQSGGIAPRVSAFAVRPQTHDTLARSCRGSCPWGKQKAVVRNDCSEGPPVDTTKYISQLDVSLSAQTVLATWTDGSTNTWDCSPHPRHTPKVTNDLVGPKCSINHTNQKKDGMAWFTSIRSEWLRIGFHDSQPVGTGVYSHGCIRVCCGAAETINKNTWSKKTKINVT